MILLCILGFNIITMIFNLIKVQYVSPQECFEILKPQFQSEYTLISPIVYFNKIVDEVNLVISTLKKNLAFDSNLRQIRTRLVPPINDYYLKTKSSIKFCWLKIKHAAEIIQKKVKTEKSLVFKCTVDHKSKKKINLIFLFMHLKPSKHVNNVNRISTYLSFRKPLDTK